MPTEYDTIHRALVRQTQTHVLTHIIRVQLPGGRVLPVRLQIKIDSYTEQSHALVECFEDGRWNEIHRISGHEISRELFDVAFAVLGIS